MVLYLVIYHKILVGGNFMKDLPRVTPGKISDNLKNTQEIFYGSDRNSNLKKPDSLTIIKKINNIFASTSHVYKSKCKITLTDGVVEKEIVGKTSTNLVTINGELIKITDIVDIEKI